MARNANLSGLTSAWATLTRLSKARRVVITAMTKSGKVRKEIMGKGKVSTGNIKIT